MENSSRYRPYQLDGVQRGGGRGAFHRGGGREGFQRGSGRGDYFRGGGCGGYFRGGGGGGYFRGGGRGGSVIHADDSLGQYSSCFNSNSTHSPIDMTMQDPFTGVYEVEGRNAEVKPACNYPNVVGLYKNDVSVEVSL